MMDRSDVRFIVLLVLLVSSWSLPFLLYELFIINESGFVILFLFLFILTVIYANYASKRSEEEFIRQLINLGAIKIEPKKKEVDEK